MWLLTREMVTLKGLWLAKMTAIVPAFPYAHVYVGLPILPRGGEAYFNTTGISNSLVTYFYQWNAAEVTCLTSEVGPYEVYSVCFAFWEPCPETATEGLCCFLPEAQRPRGDERGTAADSGTSCQTFEQAPWTFHPA